MLDVHCLVLLREFDRDMICKGRRNIVEQRHGGSILVSSATYPLSEDWVKSPNLRSQDVGHADVNRFVCALMEATCNIPQMPASSLMCPQVPASALCTLHTGTDCAQIIRGKQD